MHIYSLQILTKYNFPTQPKPLSLHIATTVSETTVSISSMATKIPIENNPNERRKGEPEYAGSASRSAYSCAISNCVSLTVKRIASASATSYDKSRLAGSGRSAFSIGGSRWRDLEKRYSEGEIPVAFIWPPRNFTRPVTVHVLATSRVTAELLLSLARTTIALRVE